MSFKIKKAAVLGAGVMGAGIAAHLTNAGIECYLLDIIPFELTEDDKKKGLTEKKPCMAKSLCGKRSGCRNQVQAGQLLQQEERIHDQDREL